MEASGEEGSHVPGHELKWRYRQVPRAAHVSLPIHPIDKASAVSRLHCIGSIRFAAMHFQACCEDDRGEGLHPPLVKDAGRTGRNWPFGFSARMCRGAASTDHGKHGCCYGSRKSSRFLCVYSRAVATLASLASSSIVFLSLPLIARAPSLQWVSIPSLARISSCAQALSLSATLAQSTSWTTSL